MSSEDKNWAKAYVLDPLIAPAPADETGPGSHFRPPPESSETKRTVTPPGASTNPFRDQHGAPKLVSEYPSPPKSASPRKSSSSYRQEALGAKSERRRGSSLSERFPGDMSHRPLDQLAKEKAVADRARHTVKKHYIRPDEVDRLDDAAGAYHHGGPYDATLFARNNSYNSSPVAAVTSTNEEALKATPHERVVDSIRGHRPLDGVAQYPPGQEDMNGHVYQYEEGPNMMIEHNPGGGAYKRWPGVQYDVDDIKGKGEPSYSIEKALKDHKRTSSQKSNEMGTNSMEMQSRSRAGSGAAHREALADSDDGVRRSGSFGKRIGSGLKKRLGHLTKHGNEE